MVRHLIPCLVVRGFVAEHTARLRGENPEITREQVCRALNQRCRIWQQNRRETTAVEHTAAVLSYHQQRNRAARLSRQRRRELTELADAAAAGGRDQEQVYRPLYHVPVVDDRDAPGVRGYAVFAQPNDAGTWQPLRARVRQARGYPWPGWRADDSSGAARTGRRPRRPG